MNEAELWQAWEWIRNVPYCTYCGGDDVRMTNPATCGRCGREEIAFPGGQPVAGKVMGEWI